MKWDEKVLGWQGPRGPAGIVTIMSGRMAWPQRFLAHWPVELPSRTKTEGSTSGGGGGGGKTLGLGNMAQT